MRLVGVRRRRVKSELALAASWRQRPRWGALTVAIALLGGGAAAADLDTSGQFIAEGRMFVSHPKLAQQDRGTSVSLKAEPQLRLTVGRNHQLTVRPFIRLDSADDSRSRWDLRRADYVVTLADWEVGLGVGHFSWRVLESVPLVDVINQTDIVEDLNLSAKLGQPYLRLGYIGRNWSLSLWALPYFRQARFPGRHSRVRFVAAVDETNARYETRLGPWQPSFASRFAATIGGLDVGLGLFSGISRQPRFIAQLSDDQVIPAYDLAHQASVDLQWTQGALVLRGEGYGRLWSKALRPLLALGVGAEYGFANLAELPLQLTIFGEVLFDNRPADAPPTLFEHDVFAGLRLALGADTTAIVGAITDIKDGRTYLRAQLRYNLNPLWWVTARVNGLFGTSSGLEGSLAGEHHGTLQLGYAL